MNSAAAIIEELRARGLVPAEAPPPPMDAVHRPWFISLMLGFAGWLAGIFLLVFLGAFLDLESRPAILTAGVVLLAGAWALYRADRQLAFLDQLALALSIAGQLAVAWGLLEDVRSAVTIAATLLVLQLLVLAIMPNRTARTIAALFAVIAWVYTVRFAIRPGEGEDIFFRSEVDFTRHGTWQVALAWLLTWLPLVGLARWLSMRESVWMADGIRDFARPALSGILLGLSLGGIATEPFMTLALGLDAIGADFSWLALFPLLSIALAMFAAWCAFHVRNDGLAGFAVFAALLHLARFYYLYGTSLTWKALIMFCLGILLLGVGLFLQKTATRGGAP